MTIYYRDIGIKLLKVGYEEASMTWFCFWVLGTSLDNYGVDNT